jgi:hypothetical protein
MGSFAPRLSRRLVDEIERLAAKPYRAADICRAVGESAERQGLHRPSYEQVRLLVGQARRRGRPLSRGQVLLEVALRARPPEAFVSHVSGTNTLRKSK